MMEVVCQGILLGSNGKEGLGEGREEGKQGGKGGGGWLPKARGVGCFLGMSVCLVWLWSVQRALVWRKFLAIRNSSEDSHIQSRAFCH
jgi:hypothetical protein